MRPVLALSALIVLAPSAVFAAQSFGTFAELAAFLVSLLNGGTALLVLAGVVAYFWGVSANIFKIQKGDTTALRTHFLWGIAILFVMVSVWGIVRMVQDALFGSGQGGGSGTIEQQGSPFDAPAFNQF